MTTNTCPRCGRVFRVLDDEDGEHPCPHCGYAPWFAGEQCGVDLVDDDATWVEEE